MILTKIPAKLLACRMLPHADARLCRSLGLPAGLARQSLALLTCDQDDSLYAALDHATKMAEVSVIYAKSFYAGSAHASGPLSGEILGVLAAQDPDVVAQGVKAARIALDELFAFYAVGTSGVNVFPTVIASVGEYLGAQAGIAPGQPLGYFIAPPLEAMLGIDAALKAADVDLLKTFGPPTETNFGGAYVTGTLDAVQAAASAFAETVADVASAPIGAFV
ncbi:MAG: ethanolamine utilization microcompartment protein EutL [Deltaproteobacteria bacterium]|nr:ethanolamine utilization microcompartment protein EutL [Deltaproteobacteria bacterium]